MHFKTFLSIHRITFELFCVSLHEYYLHILLRVRCQNIKKLIFRCLHTVQCKHGKIYFKIFLPIDRYAFEFFCVPFDEYYLHVSFNIRRLNIKTLIFRRLYLINISMVKCTIEYFLSMGRYALEFFSVPFDEYCPHVPLNKRPQNIKTFIVRRLYLMQFKYDKIYFKHFPP